MEQLLEIAKKEGRVEDEGWRVRKDGTRFWADVVITALYDDDGTLLGFGKVTRDLTERKAAEEALAELSGRLLKFQDEERRRIADELHDTTSPLLTSLSARLYTIRQRNGTKDPDIERAVADGLTLIQTTQDMVRNVAQLLHPPVLEQGGLLASLRWFVDSYPRRSGIRIDSKLPETMPKLPSDHETAVFRLVREWFDHRCKGGMTSAALRLIMTADKVQLKLEATGSDGKTPDTPPETRAAPGALTIMLAGHRERLRQMGGRLDVEAPGGTVVTATLPVRGKSRG